MLDANSELLAEVGDFIKQSTELQKWGPCRSKVWHVKNIMIVNRIYFVYLIVSWNCNFLCFLCFVCLYFYLIDPNGGIMQIKNHNIPWVAASNYHGQGVKIVWIRSSIYHGYRGQNIMDMGFNIPWVVGRYTMNRRFDIPWIGG